MRINIEKVKNDAGDYLVAVVVFHSPRLDPLTVSERRGDNEEWDEVLARTLRILSTEGPVCAAIQFQGFAP